MKRSAQDAFLADLQPVQALPVPDDDDADADDASLPPASAQAYLRRVRREAARLPLVMRAAAPIPSSAPLGAAAPSPLLARPVTPCELLPTTEWRQSFVAHFAGLRQQIARAALRIPSGAGVARTGLPSARDLSAWKALLRRSPPSPSLTHLVSLNQPAVLGLLEVYAEVLAAQRAPLCASQSQWLMALLLRLDNLLTADASTTLRDICRACQRMRLELAVPVTDERVLASVNIVITVIVHYFGQRDLADAERNAVELSATTADRGGSGLSSI